MNISKLIEANKEIADLKAQLAQHDEEIKNIEEVNKSIDSLRNQRINDLTQQVDRLTLANAGLNSRLSNSVDLHNGVVGENNEFKSQLRLIQKRNRDLLDSNRGFEYSNGLDRLFEAIDKTPRQCLSEVKSDAVKKCSDWLLLISDKAPCGSGLERNIMTCVDMIRGYAEETRNTNEPKE